MRKQVILGFIKCLYLKMTSGIQWVELGMILFSSYTNMPLPPPWSSPCSSPVPAGLGLIHWETTMPLCCPCQGRFSILPPIQHCNELCYQSFLSVFFFLWSSVFKDKFLGDSISLFGLSEVHSVGSRPSALLTARGTWCSFGPSLNSSDITFFQSAL